MHGYEKEMLKSNISLFLFDCCWWKWKKKRIWI